MPDHPDQKTVDEALRLAQQRLQPPAGAAAAGGAGLDLAVQLLQQFGPDLARVGLSIYNFLKQRGTPPMGAQPDPEAVATYVENAARNAHQLFTRRQQAQAGQQQQAGR